MRLGIAGIPDDAAALVAACGPGVSPVFVLGPGEAPPGDAGAPEVIHVPAWERAACIECLRGARLNGLWASTANLRTIVAELSASLGYPHLPCPGDPHAAQLAVQGAHLLDLHALEMLAASDCRSLPIPAWVRATCGNGDSSCMRVDHPSDFSLAIAKLRKRPTNGLVRVQPVVDGAVYRLLAFKTGRALTPFDLVAEETTTSMYRVPLGLSMPVPRRGVLLDAVLRRAARVNRGLPDGWGYVELEFVDTGAEIHLVDIQSPARLDPCLRDLVLRSQGVDLLQAAIRCALGRPPHLSPVKEVGVAMTWLLTRSGHVTGFKGVDEARVLPGIADVRIIARAGDNLTHVVDLPTRERGGYIVATGATAAHARDALDAARQQIWINTTPAVP